MNVPVVMPNWKQRGTTLEGANPFNPFTMRVDIDVAKDPHLAAGALGRGDRMLKRRVVLLPAGGDQQHWHTQSLGLRFEELAANAVGA